MSNPKTLLVEEFVPAGRFLFNSFTRDRAELAGRFSEFTPVYLAAYSSKVDEVKALEKTIVLTEAQKQATIDLYATASTLNNDLNFVSFYFKRAKLNTKMITKLKTDLNKRNIEGACEKITGVQQFIVANHVVLESKGMAVGFPAALLVTKATLETKNELQNTVRNQRKTLYDNNKLVYDALYDYIKTVANAGKIMYKGKTKVVEYTISKIIARLRSSNDGGGDIIPPPKG
jgi:hypothetical protein